MINIRNEHKLTSSEKLDELKKKRIESINDRKKSEKDIDIYNYQICELIKKHIISKIKDLGISIKITIYDNTTDIYILSNITNTVYITRTFPNNILLYNNIELDNICTLITELNKEFSNKIYKHDNKLTEVDVLLRTKTKYYKG